MYGGRGSEGAGGSGTLEEIRQIWGGKVVDGLKCKQENIVLYARLDREPVDQLKFMEGFVREAKRKELQ